MDAEQKFDSLAERAANLRESIAQAMELRRAEFSCGYCTPLINSLLAEAKETLADDPQILALQTFGDTPPPTSSDVLMAATIVQLAARGRANQEYYSNNRFTDRQEML